MADKDPNTGLSYELSAACHAMAQGDGWKAFFAEKVGGKKWALSDFENARDHNAEAEVFITRATLAQWAVEYGLQRLRKELSEINPDLPLFAAVA